MGVQQLTDPQRLYCELNGIKFDRQNGTIDSDTYQSRIANLTQEELTNAIKGAGTGNATIEIDGTMYTLSKDNRKLGYFLARNGFSDEELEVLFDKSPDEIRLAIQAKVQQTKPNKRTDNVLLLNSDRYAKLDNFEKMEKLPEKSPIYAEFEKSWPRDKYPKLYKKDGTLNEKKAWQQYEDALFLDKIYGGKSIETRINDLVQQGKTPEEAQLIVEKQNEQALKVEKRIANKQYDSNYQLTESEQRIVDARKQAHDERKYTKKYSDNIEKVTKRINNAIEKMNNWEWSHLKPEKQKKLREAYQRYIQLQNEQDPEHPIPDIFDEAGNLKPGCKNYLYQFVMDTVTGTDGQVNKSAKKGNFFQKLFKGENKEFTEKRASLDLGLDKKDIEDMGFDWEGQISWGKALLDGIPPALLGAAFGAAVGRSKSDTQTATAQVGEQVIDEQVTTPYSGVASGQVTSVDTYTDKYGTTSVTHTTDVNIPYSGETLARFVKVIPGVIENVNANANVSINAVLPATLTGLVTGILNSAINQGINGQEKDIFNENLWQTLATETPDSPEHLVTMTGMSLDSPEGKLARDIAEFYYDKDTKKFDKQTFLTDWQYNGGYKSKYLNNQEAAMWLYNLQKRGPKETPETQVTINVPPKILQQVVTNINNEFFDTQGNRVENLTIVGAETEAAGADVARLRNLGNPQKYTLTRNTAFSTNEQTALNTNGNTRVQMVVSTAGTEVEPRVNADGTKDYATPQTVTIKDKTNNDNVHIRTYKFVEFRNNKPVYELISITDADGNNIKAKHKEEFELIIHEEPDKTELKYDQETNTYHYITAKFYEYNFAQGMEDQKGLNLAGTNKSDFNYMKYSNINNQLKK